MIGTERWEVLERIGAYAASELTAQEARQVEQLILDDPQALRLTKAYLRMLALLALIGDEDSPQVPDTLINHVIRRAYLLAFFRQAEDFFASLGRAYLDAFVYYLGLRESLPGPSTGGI